MADGDESTGILYEFLIHAEWPQEPELYYGKGHWNTDDVHSRSRVSHGSSWWPALLRTNVIPFDFSRLTAGQLNWHFAIGGEGKVIAILQDHMLEIRSAKDEYGSIVGKCSVGKDIHPQWRKVTWSPDCSLIAISHSDGSVDFFDALASKLFTICPLDSGSNNLADSLNAILFVENRVLKSRWSYEVLVVNYRGDLRSFCVSPTDGYEAGHTFNLSRCNFTGVGVGGCGVITSVVYDAKFNLLVCGGSGVTPSTSNSSLPHHRAPIAGELGITAYRLLNDAPYYRLSLTLEESQAMKSKSSSLIQKLPYFLNSSLNLDTIFRLCISPDSSIVAAVHVSGNVTLWDFPSLRFRKCFPLDKQPHYDDSNPAFAHSLKKHLATRDPLRYLVADINWWSEKAVIIARCSGAITVSSISNFENLLGTSAEWFDGYPRVSIAHQRGFLVMECENRLTSRRRSSSYHSDDENSTDDDDEELDDVSHGDRSIIRLSTNMMRTALYYMTDSERFQPQRKRPKFSMRTYRLLCLKATSPESLFARKLDQEEYGEALGLAQLYNLDCDLVYQRQWRNADVSVLSIQDYLSKISKRSWVLHECLDRVPKTLNATRALLEYGLRGTDLEALISIGEGNDEGKFILCNLPCVNEDFYVDEFNPDAVARREAHHREVRSKILAKVNFENLSLDQKQLCFTRQKLLKYLEKLNTYESMLGAVYVASDNFDDKFFREFRAQPAAAAAMEFARQGNWRFVAALFTYHGSETLPHRLAILSNFPETMSPSDYCSILPEAGYGPSDPPVIPWIEEIHLERDWVESDSCRNGLGQLDDDTANLIYEDEPKLERFCTKNVIELQHLTEWYSWRANAIEERSRLVDHALDLIRLGIERNVRGLNTLHDDLLTLEMLVYECFVDDSLRLEHLRSMDNIDKIRLLMSRSSTDQFVKNVRRWLIPFLDRRERTVLGSGRTLLREYLLSIAKHDLTLCVKIFEQCRVDQNDPIIRPVNDIIALALDCIYACEEDDQLNNANAILECLSIRRDHVTHENFVQVDSLKKHLAAAEVLRKYGILKPIAYIRDCQKNAVDVKQLLTLLTRVASRKIPDVSEISWRELLEDVLELQINVFQCVDRKLCLEIFFQTMLCSGRKDYISLAGELVVGSKTVQNLKPVGSLFKGIGGTLSPKILANDAKVLVIAAAKEYFNSASDSDDPCMELAKHCLHLVDEPDDAIQAEIDLIDALPILNEFRIKLLPLQVRLCENRLQLIEQVFKSKPTAYKNSQKLMTLAHLMRVGQDVRLWECRVQILVATAAFEARDLIACYQACHYIVLQKYVQGWEICLKLGQCDDFLDIRARRELLAFCAVCCCGDRLEDVVCTRHKLEIHSVQLRLSKVVSGFDEGLSNITSVDGNVLTLNKSMKLASKVRHFLNSATKQCLSVIESPEIRDQSLSWDRSEAQSSYCENLDFDRISVPLFYLTLLPDCSESPLNPSYTSYSMPNIQPDSALSLELLLLRLALLQENTLNDCDGQDPCEANDEETFGSLTTNMLADISSNLLPHDTLLGLAHLLAINDPVLVDKCFGRFPNTGVCLQLALLCFSLQICQEAELIDRNELYELDPKEVTKLGLRYAKANRKGIEGFNKKLEKNVELVLNYKKKLNDFLQANALRSLGRGVDVVRFSEDDEYKRETVLGLAMSTDEKTYKTAVSLANRYNIHLWDLYMVHVEYLFCDDDMTASGIEKRLSNLAVMPVLLEDATKLRDRLRNVVCSTIAGTDHPRFLYYLKLLTQCLEKEDAKQMQAVVRLLTKLQSIAPGLDFLKLVYDTEVELIELLKPVLNGANIQAIVKTVPSIKSVLHRSVNTSELYCAWLIKAFCDGNDGNSVVEGVNSNKAPSTMKKSHRLWMARYDSCKEHFEHLEPNALIMFVKGTLFVEKALDNIIISTRIQLMSHILRYARSEWDKCKEGTAKREAWNEAIQQFNKDKKHLEWIDSELVEEVKKTADPNIYKFVRKFELNGPDSTNTILFDCIVDGQSIETLQWLVGILPGCDSTPGDVILEVVSILHNVIRNVDDGRCVRLAERDPICALRAVVESIFTHIARGGDLIDPNDVLEHLLPSFTNSSISISTRLIIIKLMEKICPKDSPHLKIISACKVRTIIMDTWNDIEVLPDDFENDQRRQILFRKILAECKSLIQFGTLVQLLIDWPPLPCSNSAQRDENSWCLVMDSILRSSNEDQLNRYNAVIDVLRQARNVGKLNIQCLEPIIDQFSSAEHFIYKLKFALLTEYKSLHTNVLKDVTKLDKNETLHLDAELCSLLLERRLTSRTVGTPLYRSLVDYILAELTLESVKDIAKQLRIDGHEVEAASLLTARSQLPVGMRTFNSAIGLLRRWTSTS